MYCPVIFTPLYRTEKEILLAPLIDETRDYHIEEKNTNAYAKRC